jgi:hypothetical protein
MSKDDSERTPEEKRVIEDVAEDRSEEFAKENEEAILADAERLNLI